MSMPFYVPPEQLVKDRAEYARKGIARGKSTGPDFREAYEIQKVVEAAIASSKERSWQKV